MANAPEGCSNYVFARYSSQAVGTPRWRLVKYSTRKLSKHRQQHWLLQVQVLTIAGGPIQFEPRAAMEKLQPRLTKYMTGRLDIVGRDSVYIS